MAVYRPVVAFTCHFSEAVALHNEERVFVPNIESISPRNGESDTFVVEARVEDNTLGVLTLVLGAGAFKGGEELSEEYRVSVPCGRWGVRVTRRRFHPCQRGRHCHDREDVYDSGLCSRAHFRRPDGSPAGADDRRDCRVPPLHDGPRGDEHR